MIDINESDISPYFDYDFSQIDVYEISDESFGNRGGQFYYTQNRPGTKWVDSVNNKKGWTIDFGLKIEDIQNGISTLSDDSIKGIGVYVNDGEKKETITFLTQEIIFQNAGISTVFDTTSVVDYRLTGKDEELKLYAKKSSENYYNLISDIHFASKATQQGNGLKPSITEDYEGNLHSVWYDDGNGLGQIYYTKETNGIWSTPEIISDSSVLSQFPQIFVDVEGTIYVAYEIKQTNFTSIAIRCKTIDWGKETVISDFEGDAKKPKISVDWMQNLLVVWEDYRTIQPEIYIAKFHKYEQKWDKSFKISTSTVGAYNPYITSYFDDIYVSYTDLSETSSTIKIVRLSSATMVASSTVIISGTLTKSEFSSIIATASGRIVCVWHDNTDGKYYIHGCVLSPLLSILSSEQKISSSFGGARYPVLSEQKTDGTIHIVWQDYISDYHEFLSDEVGGSSEVTILPEQPLNSTLFAAKYDIISNTFINSTNTGTDAKFAFLNRNAIFPNVPRFFNSPNGLPVVYERNDYTEFLSDYNKYSNIGFVFYASFGEDFYPSDDSDFYLNELYFRKEIRFGDFSDSINGHLVFSYFKYYTDDAVEPYRLVEITANDFNLLGLNAKDVAINNYGDVWIVGTGGMYYYIDKSNYLAIVGKPDETHNMEWPSSDTGALNFSSISFDAHNFMFIGKKDGGVWYSTEHVRCYKQLIENDNSNVTALNFNKDNVLFIGTDDGLKIGTIAELSDRNTIAFTLISTFLPSTHITCISTDENNITWIGTRQNGIYRYYKNQLINLTTKDGLPSNVINDISIRNTAIRYVATSCGIVKMSGSSIDKIIRTDNSDLYNNNIKSILWQEPNILWAGTLSKINQIILNETEDNYDVVLYESNPSYIVSKNDLQTFYIISENNQTIYTSDIIEVYINGNIISTGYQIGFDESVNQMVIRFDSSLLNTDVVEIKVRKDIELKASFKQTAEEKESIGSNLIRVKDLLVSGDYLYLISEGDENEIKINDSTSQIPYDKVFLDTYPPTGTIEIKGQIDRNRVAIAISGVSDIDENEVDGSGVSQMIISNYPNFTTDGNEAQAPVPFQSEIEHELDMSFSDSILQYTFSSKVGNKIEFFGDKNEIYATSSTGGSLLLYNSTTQGWDIKFSYLNNALDNAYVDFVVKYSERLIVSVGYPDRAAKIFIYNLIYDGNVLTNTAYSGTKTFNESRAFCCKEINGILYIGCGKGESGFAPNGGVVYAYNGYDSPIEIVSGLDNNVYSLTVPEGSDNLFASTGDNGYIYEIDILNKSASIIYRDTDPIINIESLKLDDNSFIFTGGQDSGIIRKTLSTSGSFGISFRTVASSDGNRAGRVSSLKTITMADDKKVIFASIGNVLNYYSESATWTWKYTHTEIINDFTYDKNNDIFYIISDNGITQLNPAIQTKNVYLKLIDRAGNESSLYNTDNSMKTNLFDSISISDLIEFVNENQILELDEFGNTVSIFANGSSLYYSANKIEQESGIYDSNIFDGTNNLVKWNAMSWNSTEPTGTEILMYLRTSSSKTDILLVPWTGPFTIGDRDGINLSSFTGKYIQFRAELNSTLKDTSPLLHSVSIQSVTSESVHFFTTNFTLPSKVNRGILTSNKIVPVAADIVFGINTTNSVDWNDYQIIEENRLFNVNQLGENIRVGIKFITPTETSSEQILEEEYNSTYIENIEFDFTNTEETNLFSFRIGFYSDEERTEDVFVKYSSNDSAGWYINGIELLEGSFYVLYNNTASVEYRPDLTQFDSTKTYYLKIDAHNGTDFINISNDFTWRTGAISTDEYCGGLSNVPIVNSFGIMLELDNNEFVTLNI